MGRPEGAQGAVGGAWWQAQNLVVSTVAPQVGGGQEGGRGHPSGVVDVCVSVGVAVVGGWGGGGGGGDGGGEAEAASWPSASFAIPRFWGGTGEMDMDNSTEPTIALPVCILPSGPGLGWGGQAVWASLGEGEEKAKGRGARQIRSRIWHLQRAHRMPATPHAWAFASVHVLMGHG